MHIQVCRDLSGATVNEDIVRLSRRKIARWAKNVRHHTVKSSRGTSEPLQHHKPLPQHTARRADGGKRNFLGTHQDLVKAVRQV